VYKSTTVISNLETFYNGAKMARNMAPDGVCCCCKRRDTSSVWT